MKLDVELQMSFDLIVENLRAELGAEKRALAASEVAHLAAMQKQEVCQKQFN
jgi:hypothetical protein